MKRKIAAILAADAPNYGRLIAARADETLADLTVARAIFDDVVNTHDGRIFNTSGASVLAEFSSSVEAVRCAIGVQRRLASQPSAAPNHDHLTFRIGLTIGDIVEHQGDLLGDGVNVAARLAALAEDGGICVSRTVYEQVRNKVEISVTDLGLQALKNIPEPVHALSLRAGSDGKVPAFARPGPSGSTSINWVLIGWVGLGVLGALVGWQVLFASIAPRAPANATATQREGEIAKPGAPDGRVPNAASSSREFDRRQKMQRCSEILERIQAGAGSAADQVALQRDCQ
jgi:class 3 adenylate cyclase